MDSIGLSDDEKFASIFSKRYWREAAAQIKDVRMLTIAALFVALRIVVKFIKIPLAANLSITFDAYVNSIGSVIYGPMVGLVVGLISDVLGQIAIGQLNEFFLPYAIVEMSSSFLFGLFFWKRKISVSRAIWAKFTVNLICNIFMNSLCTKWMYLVFYGSERAEAYSIINGLRIVKNLIMFPLEATIIVVVLSATVPMLTRMKLIDQHYCFVEKPSKKRMVIEIAFLTVLAVGLIWLYVVYLKDFIDALGIKFW